MILGLEFEDMHYLSEAVRGAKLLDRAMSDWPSKIDLDLLDMSSDTECILGQLYRSYFAGVDALIDAFRVLAPAHYGFNVYSGQHYDSVRWGQLRAAWLRVIAERA